MKGILCVSLLILLMQSADAASLTGESTDGKRLLTLTAWDATILASKPERNDSFSLWTR